MTERVALRDRQAARLGMIRVAHKPGLIVASGDATMRSLQRRGLAASRPDPTGAGKSIWTLTPAGREWLEAADRERLL